jgi:hypothetical protein
MQRIRVNVLRARLRPSGAASPVEQRLEELEAELVLLREDNARLAAEQARPANPGRIVEQLRAVSAVPTSREVEADDAWEQMTEALVTRELLLGVCVELERLGARLRERLESGHSVPEPAVFQLGPAGNGSPGLPSPDASLAVPRGTRPRTSTSASEGV